VYSSVNCSVLINRNILRVLKRNLELFVDAATLRYLCLFPLYVCGHTSGILSSKDNTLNFLIVQISPAQFEIHAGWAYRRKP
jgi:hypothetical protein